MKEIRILLVDDEDNYRQTLAKRLQKRDFAPQQAGSGEECLSILENRPMDVVILDVKMPGMNGIETLHRIKAKHPETEVILLTGQAATEDGVEGIKSGAFDYLTKPIELDHLTGKIVQALEKIKRSQEKRKEAEYRLKVEQQMIVAERLASLGTLATGVAHEINNPLAIIGESAGWIKLLLERKEMANMPLKSQFEMALDKIEASIERAKRITHQLLGVVKKSDSVFSEVDLYELIDGAIQLVNREALNKDIEIVRSAKMSDIIIWSDPYQLRQVFINLLTNAIHATGAGGRIDITGEFIDNWVAFYIKDTGEGIPKENLGKIFEPFFSTKSPGQGTGLGLFVTRSIIEKLGGKIEVDSRLGQGSIFCVKLPKYHEAKEKIE